MKSAQDVAEKWNRAVAAKARNYSAGASGEPVYTTASEDREAYARGEINLAEFEARVAQRVRDERAAERRRMGA